MTDSVRVYLQFPVFYEEENFSFGGENIFFLRRFSGFSPQEVEEFEAGRDENVLKTSIFLLIDGFRMTKTKCRFVGKIFRKLT